MPTRSFSLTVIRPDDLLLLRVDFLGVDFTAGTPPTIAGQNGARLVVNFQPQHVAEEAFWEIGNTTETAEEKAARGPGAPPPPGNDPLKPPGQVRSRLAGPSRLAFTIPAATNFPLTLPDLLAALKTLPLVVPPVASYETPAGCAGVPVAWLPLLGRPAAPRIAPPNPLETAIEVPYRLHISPDQFGWWDHATTTIEHDGRVELWHTRLGSRRASRDPRVRAVWSPDFDANALQIHDVNAEPFRSSLDRRDRNELVQLTSNYHIEKFTPTPVATRRMMLTTLGAWLDVYGNWTPPNLTDTLPLTVEEWRHLATMGRDHYVRVVYAGYLFPFRHRASLVKITERKFALANGGQGPGFVAYNFQRMYILVRERTKNYGPRDLPFRSVEITTAFTPDLAKPEDSDLDGKTQEAFWPRLAPGTPGSEFQFHLIGTDWRGEQTEFTAPLIFVSRTTNGGVDPDGIPTIDKIIAEYNALDVASPLRRREMHGQGVAFAPADKPGDTTLESVAMTFAAEKVTGDEPRFRPLMRRAEVDVPAVNRLLDKRVISNIEWEPTYLQPTGNAIANAGDVFVRITNAPRVEFAHEKSGGLITPDMTITAVSRSLGPVGGKIDDIVGKPDAGGTLVGTLTPGDIFKGITLMGGIELEDIIELIGYQNAASAAGKELPQLVSVLVPAENLIRTSYTWNLLRPQLRLVTNDPDPKKNSVLRPFDDGSMVLSAIVEKPLNNDPPRFKTTGTISNFEIVLLPEAPLVRLQFDFITFTAEAGKKLDTSVKLRGLEFDGILKFVNTLQDFIPLDGFSDPPYVNFSTSPPGVNVGFTLGLPTIGIGIMTMQNVSLSAGFYLPFIGSEVMNFRFAFCERHQPFTLTVSLFGGGGFFAINLGLAGVKSIEMALEFGASIALNLGVASGQASIMAGFYFQMTDKGFALTGYFRACGSLSVLGIITVSVEFYLGLTYESKGMPAPHGGKLWGQARLTVKIKILFFSTSVGISMEKIFAGSDPTFRLLIAPDDWTAYCGAFDDYPVVVGE